MGLSGFLGIRKLWLPPWAMHESEAGAVVQTCMERVGEAIPPKLRARVRSLLQRLDSVLPEGAKSYTALLGTGLAVLSVLVAWMFAKNRYLAHNLRTREDELQRQIIKVRTPFPGDSTKAFIGAVHMVGRPKLLCVGELDINIRAWHTFAMMLSSGSGLIVSFGADPGPAGKAARLAYNPYHPPLQPHHLKRLLSADMDQLAASFCMVPAQLVCTPGRIILVQ